MIGGVRVWNPVAGSPPNRLMPVPAFASWATQRGLNASSNGKNRLKWLVPGRTVESQVSLSEVVMAFIQVIEIRTTRPDEVEALVAEWRTQTAGRRTAIRGTFTQDRERPNTYVQLVEFPSYEDAMVNSDLPETAIFAERLGQLCDGPMLFRNLDVRSVEEL